MTCGYGHGNPEGQKFCGECGAPIFTAEVVKSPKPETGHPGRDEGKPLKWEGRSEADEALVSAKEAINAPTRARSVDARVKDGPTTEIPPTDWYEVQRRIAGLPRRTPKTVQFESALRQLTGVKWDVEVPKWKMGSIAFLFILAIVALIVSYMAGSRSDAAQMPNHIVLRQIWHQQQIELSMESWLTTGSVFQSAADDDTAH